MALAITGLGSTTSASGSSIALTAGAISAGDLVVVVVANRQGSTSVSGVSDGTNTYTKAVSIIESAGIADAEIWYRANAAAVSSPTITATLSGAAANGIAINAARITGATPSTPLDKTASSATASVATGALAQAAEIVIGVFANFGATPTFTESTGFTTLYNQTAGLTNYGLLTSYDIVNSASTVTYGPSQTGGGTGNGVAVASFKAMPVFGFNMPMLGM